MLFCLSQSSSSLLLVFFFTYHNFKCLTLKPKSCKVIFNPNLCNYEQLGKLFDTGSSMMLAGLAKVKFWSKLFYVVKSHIFYCYLCHYFKIIVNFQLFFLKVERGLSVLVQLLWNLHNNHFTVFYADMDIETPIDSIVYWSWDTSTGNLVNI